MLVRVLACVCVCVWHIIWMSDACVDECPSYSSDDSIHDAEMSDADAGILHFWKHQQWLFISSSELFSSLPPLDNT